ncbi:DUF221-domain-containing protein [Polyplosphaeria fusca]|uniref:DUF221-domain-containing protein n=1 Tax=Polyplosphaeria fusca TaxID=682080 RepID=A0A9P4RAQ5_9PLEO|nr:DUF221-domain-containing protein [Polyplosphaeria fusca]
MSGPSSEGRPSVSSEPSVVSSNTLNSRFSGAHADNGEGSSSQRTSLAGSTRDGGSGNGSADAPPREPQSTFMAEDIGAQEFANRRHRVRRSGGFLLDSALPAGPKTRQQPTGSVHREDLKGKNTLRDRAHQENSSKHRIPPGANGTPSHGSPLSQQVILRGNDVGNEENQDSSTYVPDASAGIRVPKTRRSDIDGPAVPQERQSIASATPPQSGLDPNQLVHMALNLSESRKRNLSAGQLLVPQPAGSRRVTSVGMAPDASFMSYGPGSSIKQYLNEQRRTSRNISPGGRNALSSLRHMSASTARSPSMSLSTQQLTLSEATIARRDKARMYIELRIEYLRLLDQLPPLKPDASAPGNYYVSASNVPGSPQAQLTRMPSHAGKRHELGRAYNPLQYLRNRRTRARERKSLEHPPDEFQDINRVREWVDQVQTASQNARYRQHNGVLLPQFHQDHDTKDTPSKPTRPRMGWIFTSEELLADAHWLEQGDNKTLIEDRHGRKVFPPEEPYKQDLLQPRASTENPEKRRRSWVEGLPRLSSDMATADESEPDSEHGRKRRLLPAFRAESPKRKKHGWRGSRPRSTSDSDTSGSESDQQKSQPGRARLQVDVNNNTGPLALQMRQLMEKEGIEAISRSPAIVSPDTPDKWGVGHPALPDDNAPRSSIDSVKMPNGSALSNSNIGFKAPPKKLRNKVVEEVEPEPRVSLDDLDSTAPNTPLHTKRFLHFGADLSPSHSRSNSVTRKAKKNKMDHFRSDESTKSNKNDLESAGSEKKRGSRHLSEEMAEASGISSAILSAPGAVKHLLTQRKNDSVNSLESPDALRRKDLRDSREPSSAVTRFFKGVKNEGSRVGEFIFRRDKPTEDSDSDTVSSTLSQTGSDTGEDSRKSRWKPRPGISRSVTTETIGSIASRKNGRYHIDLPSFRSSAHIEEDETNATDSQVSDPIAKQAQWQSSNRSPRFDRLRPPRMDLRSISTASSTGSPQQRSPSPGQERLNKVLARPGGVGAAGYPVTVLAHPPDLSDSNRKPSRPTLEGKRHWSITDDNGDVIQRKVSASVITQSEIARVQALFLCSGVKAGEIARRAHITRPEAPSFLIRAAKEANVQLISVPRKEEHVLAARILVRTLEASTQALHVSADEFRESTVKDVTDTISSLRSRVEAELFPRVRSSGDEAVRITNEVSGQAPLAVKQINDEIDRMIRMRRRRMRWPQGGASLAAVLSAFVPTWGTAVLFVFVFCTIRHRYPKIYSPRTFIGTVPEKDRTPSATRSYFDWVHTLLVVPDKFLLYHHSLDCYLWLRFLRTAMFICVVGCCLTWPILMPINATGGGTSSQLDKITIGNVSKKKHLYAHAVLAWVFFAFVMFTVARERLWLIGLRQAWSLSKSNAKRLSSRTVLFLSAPKEALDKQNMQKYFGNDAVRIWPAAKADKLESMTAERNANVEQLEAAEINLIRKVNQTGRKERKTQGSRNENTPSYDQLSNDTKKSLRPTHRLAKPPKAGQKVDSINFFRDQIKEKESEIDEARKSYDAPETQGGGAAVFVEYRDQTAAQKAYQQIAASGILTLNPRYTGVMPGEVIWKNIVIPTTLRLSQEAMAVGLVVATIIFWTIPVGFVASISNISYLAENYEWLKFLRNLPDPVIGLLSGLLPPLATSLLSKYVPNIFRYIFKTFGEPTNTAAELKVMTWYYVFQVFQVFLISTLSSGAAAVVSQLATNPGSVPTLLAKQLPSSANFYLTYFIIQGLTSATDNLLNYSDLLMYLCFGFLFDKTPRQKYNRYTSLRNIAWGKVFPKYANFVIIAIVYSCIAPLVLGFAAAGLAIFYVSYRYMLLYTVQAKIDTKGQSYAIALQQVLTGVYLGELCLIGLFSLRNAPGPSIMVTVLFALTILYHIAMNRYFAPLEKYLPTDLATSDDDDEVTPLLSAAEEGEVSQSRIPNSAQQVLDPLARFFQPHVFASHKAMKAWLADGDFDADDVPEYSEEAVEKAYTNPAFTSATPLVWLARDEMGASKHEVGECEDAGLKASDRGAWVDEKGSVPGWSVDDFGEVPIFKDAVRW